MTNILKCDNLIGFVLRRSYSNNTKAVFPKLRLYNNRSNYVNAILRKQALKQYWQNLQFRLNLNPRLADHKRKKIVLLGTGWGAVKFLKHIDVSHYDVTVVSPNNYFSFTPLLPSACVGTLSPRACFEPIRGLLTRGGKLVMNYHEGWAIDVNLNDKKVECEGTQGDKFSVLFDYLVLAVGSESNTFGIPGVKENAYFLKNVQDARKVHSRILDNLERASLPNVSETEKKQLLHFVVVGGGPTGVEVSAELADFLKEDVAYYFPDLIKYAKVTLVEMLPNVLPQFNPKVSRYTRNNLEKMNIDVLTETQVTGVTASTIILKAMDKKSTVEVPCEFVLWASGVGQVPFIKHMLSKIPNQNKNRALKVNENLQVLGAPCIYGIGDCSLFTPEPLSKHTDLFYEWLKSSGKEITSWLAGNKKYLSSRFPQVNCVDLKQNKTTNVSNNDEGLTDQQKLEMFLKKIDETYKPPAPTAQNASQEALYLAATFNRYLTSEEKINAPAYNFNWRGSMAYVGDGNSVIMAPGAVILGGLLSKILWRGFYFSEQLSKRNRILCLSNWYRTMVLGRDVAREKNVSYEKRDA